MAEGSVARQPDLLTCDDEPIHIPGAIQPHGLLLALAADMTIVAGSDNLPELTGLAIGALIGRSAADVFDSETHNRLTIALAEPGAAVGAPITVGFTMRKDAGFIGSWHRHDQLIFLELEPPQRDVAEPQAFFRRTNSAIRRLQAAETLESACAAAAQEVRKITGFDRVMIYRFASDFSGEVIAEDRCAEVESKLGLHYPASTVPAQARRLYTINPVRIIPDINYRPVPVTPDLNPVTGRPIDLSFAILRSVSPVHLEFMRNIGMHGTMSISILRGERLWGLIVCHHRTPYYVDLDGRQACELVAQVLAWQIGVMEEGSGATNFSLLKQAGDVEENPGPMVPKKKRKVSNLLTVHQNLPALPVDATSDEVRKNLMDMFRDRQAFSEHTWKMLLSVCRSWAAWCKLNNRKWFPAEPEDVRDYLLYLQARGLAVKTIQQHLGQLNMLHRRSGLPRPSDSNAVSLVMRRIRKENVDAGERAKQALAFERTDFDQVRSLMENSDRCQDIRNLAFLGIAYNTLLRIAEIARIRVKDISRTDGGRMLIHIGRTKTLVSTAGVEKALSLGVTKLVERWISVSGVADDPNNYLFCRVRKNGVAAPSATSQLSTRALEGIFEATHRLIYGAKDDSGQRYLAWSGHSARVGAARDMARAGVSIPEIMQAGGWTNVNIVMNYIRNLDSETGAMVRLLD